LQYLACTLPVPAVVTKRNTLMFSAWCQYKLLLYRAVRRCWDQSVARGTTL